MDNKTQELLNAFARKTHQEKESIQANYIEHFGTDETKRGFSFWMKSVEQKVAVVKQAEKRSTQELRQLRGTSS